jgi:hypothetical protein
MAGAPRPSSTQNSGLPDILASAFDFAKTFGQYELNPQSLMQGNQRVRPGIMDGYEYTPQPGETQDDAGRWYTPDGQLIQFQDRPALAELLDLMPAVGGLAAPANAGGAVLGAGPIIRARASEAMAMDPSIGEHSASFIEAMRKRAPMGYPVPDWDKLGKADNALTKMSMAPSKNAMGVAEKAGALGYDTPMFHVSGYRAGDKPLKDGSVPFLVPDPNIKGRGAVYFGDLPSSIVKSGAAVGSGGGEIGATIYPFLGRAPFVGEHGMTDEMMSFMPDKLNFNSTAPNALADGQSIQDLIEGIRSGPYREQFVEQRLAAAQPGDRDWIKKQIEGYGDTSLAKSLARMYYDPERGGALIGADEFMPIGSGNTQPGVPHYGTYENGGVKSGHGSAGAPSYYQTSHMGMGWTGSRVADETGNYGGKTIAVPYAPAIRSPNAKFDPRKADTADTLAAKAPPGWFAGLFERDDQEPQL